MKTKEQQQPPPAAGVTSTTKAKDPQQPQPTSGVRPATKVVQKQQQQQPLPSSDKSPATKSKEQPQPPPSKGATPKINTKEQQPPSLPNVVSKTVSKEQKPGSEPESPKSTELASSEFSGSGKSRIQSTSRSPSPPDSPKWPQPGGGGWGERAWTKEVIWCRSHGPAPPYRPRVFRDLEPKRKEWEGQFQQPIIDKHCEFHGNSVQEYFQKELKRCSRIRPSIKGDLSPEPEITLDEFLAEKHAKRERSLSNQKERDRKSLAYINKREKENIDTIKQEQDKSTRDDARRIARFQNRGRKVAKPVKERAAKSVTVLDERDASRFKDPTPSTPIPVKDQTLVKIDHPEREDPQHGQVDVRIYPKPQKKQAGGKRGFDKRPTFVEEWLQNPTERFTEKPTKPILKIQKESDILRDIILPERQQVTQETKPFEGSEFESQTPADILKADDSQSVVKLSEADDSRCVVKSSSAFGAESDWNRSFRQRYHWILLPQHFGPAPSHTEDPPQAACFGPIYPDSTPQSANAFPAVRVLDAPVGYHDTFAVIKSKVFDNTTIT